MFHHLASTDVRPRLRPVGAVLIAVALALGSAACSSGKKDATSSSSSASGSPIDQILEDGLKAQGQGQLDVARQKYLEVTQKDPTNKIAFYDLGVVYQQLNSLGEARAAYEKAIAIDAKYSPALFNLAVLETPVNMARAEELYRKLLEINGNDANVHFNLGLLLKLEGKGEDGDREIQAAVAIDPSLASRIPATPDSSTSSS